MLIIELLVFSILCVLLLIGGIYASIKNKKVFKCSLVVVGICFFIVSGYHLYTIIQPSIFPDFAQTLSSNWKIDFPKPRKEILIASNGDGLPGDTFLLFQYNNSNDINRLNHIFEWSDKDAYILDKISDFMQHLNAGLNQSSGQNLKSNTHLEEKIKSNSKVLNTNFKYYYIKKDYNSFIIFIFSTNEKRIYIMQSMG